MLKSLPARIIWLSICICCRSLCCKHFWILLFCLGWFFRTVLFSEILFWNFQGCITVYLSRCFVALCSAATLISYHVLRTLSTSFLNFFQKLFRDVSRTLIQAFEYRGKSCFSRWIFNISHPPPLCQQVFYLFLHFPNFNFKRTDASRYTPLSRTAKDGRMRRISTKCPPSPNNGHS